MSWDGKIYNKYKIEHTDGTPLKGKRYFVLRLDSDSPEEAARVAAAMRAYKNELRQCDVGTTGEQTDRMLAFCARKYKCTRCEHHKIGTLFRECTLRWANMPYKEGGTK